MTPSPRSFSLLSQVTDEADLQTIVLRYLHDVAHPPVDAVVRFYLSARRLAGETLLDGARQSPRYRCAPKRHPLNRRPPP